MVARELRGESYARSRVNVATRGESLEWREQLNYGGGFTWVCVSRELAKHVRLEMNGSRSKGDTSPFRRLRYSLRSRSFHLWGNTVRSIDRNHLRL